VWLVELEERVVFRVWVYGQSVEGGLAETFFESPEDVKRLAYRAAYFGCVSDFLEIYREEGLEKAKEFLERRMSSSKPEIEVELEKGGWHKRVVLEKELAETYIKARKELKPIIEKAFDANLTESAIQDIVRAYAASGLKGAERKLNYYLALNLSLTKGYVDKGYAEIVIGSSKHKCYVIAPRFGAKCSETIVRKAEELPDNPFKIESYVSLLPSALEKILDMSEKELEKLYEAVELVVGSQKRRPLEEKLSDAIVEGKLEEFVKKLKSRRKSYEKRREKLDKVYDEFVKEYSEKGYVKTSVGYVLYPNGSIELVTFDGRYLRTEWLPDDKMKSALYSLTRGYISVYFKEEKPSEDVLKRVAKIDEGLALALKLNYS
jgi:DNA-binding transcriptional regulator YhcF (GntR family)